MLIHKFENLENQDKRGIYGRWFWTDFAVVNVGVGK